MELKTILNTSEYLTYKILCNALDQNEFYLLSQTPMDKIIDIAKSEVPKNQYQHYLDTTFDFVICNRQGKAALIIEFDGPTHFENKKQHVADFVKAELCHKANLPILRIDDSYLGKIGEETILSFIIMRFSKWNIEKEELILDCELHYKSITDNRDNPRLATIDYLDFDPTIEFNYRHHLIDFSGIDKLLYTDYGVVNKDLADDDKKSSFEFMSSIPIYGQDGNINYMVRYNLNIATRDNENTELRKIAIEERTQMRWYTFQYSIDGSRRSYYYDLPGISIPDLCENIADYRCLSKIASICKDYKKKGIFI